MLEGIIIHGNTMCNCNQGKEKKTNKKKPNIL